MRRALTVLIFFLLIVSGLKSHAQQDTLFWFAAPEIAASEGDNPVYLRVLSYSSPATVTITLPANGGFAPIVVNLLANSVDSVNLTPFLALIESPAGNVASPNGLKISATSNITAYYEVQASSNRALFSLKGTKALGTNFYTPFPTFWDNGVTTPASFSSFEVVATENNTTVLITPRTAITGHAMNATFSVVLNEGETYSARDADLVGINSLAGSIVSSNKPVAVTVFTGALDQGGCLSSAGDQITRADVLGENYIVRKGTGFNDRFYILATQNGTNLSITSTSGTTTTLINWSETSEYILTDTVAYIAASKPVYVLHINGYGCSLSAAQVPNTFCAGTYSASFSRSTTDSLGLVLFTRTGFEGDFAINGNTALIQASDFTTVPGTNGEFKVALIHYSTAQVPVNSYNEVTNSGDIFGMGVVSGNTSNGSAYAYFNEFISYPFVDAGLSDTVCANVPFALNGVVGGGSVTGVWSGTGYGSFLNGTTALSNSYVVSPLDTIVTPVNLILTSTGPCPLIKDTLVLHVTPAPIVNANTNQIVCANNANVQLNGMVTGGANTGQWSTLGSGTFSPADSLLNAIYVPSPADTVAGSVQLILTSTHFGNCLAVSDTMMVTIGNSPTVIAGADTLMACANNPNVSLSGSVTGPTTTGKWVSAGNGLFSPNNLSLNTTYQPSANDVSIGSVWIYLESTNNGSCTKVSDSVLVMFTPEPTVEAGFNIIACTNVPSIVLAGNVSGPTTTGIWSVGNGSYNPSDSDLNASYTPTAAEVNAGSMFLTLTSTNNGNCAAVSDNVQINFVAPPFANFSTTDVCLNLATTLNDFSLPGFGSVTNWDWNFGDNTTSTDQNNLHTYGNAGNYAVELIVTNSAGCTDTASNNLTVFELPTADFSYSGTCTNNQIIVHFEDSSTSLNDPINYWFYDFGGQGTAATEDASQLFIPSGNFVITHVVSTVNNCSDTIIRTVNVPERPEAGFFYNTGNGLNIGATFSFFDTSANASTWDWIFGDGTGAIDQDPEHTYFDNGTYTVTQYVTNSLGCTDSAFTVINISTVTNEITTLIPNAISPNGDGRNDVWKLDFIERYFPNASIVVFNRWGQELFRSIGYNDPWNGTYNGAPVPDGTYYYVIELNDEAEPNPYKGALFILKNAD